MASRWLLALVGVLSAVSAADLIFSMDKIEDWEAGYEMSLQLTATEGAPVAPTYDVVPLTRAAGLNETNDLARQAIYIQGNLFAVNTANFNNITTSDAVVYLSCDNNSNSSNISPSDMLTDLMSYQPELKAILLYSTQGNSCGLGDTNPKFKSIYTMIDAVGAMEVYKQADPEDGVDVRAVITGNTTTAAQDTQESQTGNNSAVAMSVLYSITGLITLLFLIIIATGAIRAHRYPERYGPRSGTGGRPRQSRAKGLARAVLETLPIVKFGDPTPAKEDPALELESQTSVAAAHDPAMGTRLSAIPEEPQRSPVKNDEPAATTEEVPADAPAGQADAEARESQERKGDDEYQGCSICTEDFTVGEDVRVLPCNHKFHPTCVDPWLVNISGTCPLCRLDLRPHNEAGEAIAADDEALAPPLGAESGETEQPSTHAHSRRSSRLLDLNRLRHASVEERLEILRRHRSQQQDGHSHHRLSDRLRERFRINTTRTQYPSRENPGIH